MLERQPPFSHVWRRLIPFYALAISVLLHYALIAHLDFYSSKRQTPNIFVWPGILPVSDMVSFRSNERVVADLRFFMRNRSLTYFPNTLVTGDRPIGLQKQPHAFYPATRVADTTVSRQERPVRREYYYLWEPQPLLRSHDKKIVPHKAFVSSYGKAILVFPEKLLGEPGENNPLQEYVQEASLFFDDKFFWTKLEGIVK